MTLIEYLITGSYVFSAGAYLYVWKILQVLNRIEKQLEYSSGLLAGQEHEKRLSRLEERMGYSAGLLEGQEHEKRLSRLEKRGQPPD